MEKGRDFCEFLSDEAPFNVRRVTSVDEIRSAFRTRILAEKGVDLLNPKPAEKKIVEPMRRTIDSICKETQGLVVWGVFGLDGQLERITEIRGIEQLQPKDAKAFKALYMHGLQRNPEVFGSTFENERERTIPQFKKFIQDNYVVGVKHSYQERGKVKEDLVGIGNLRRETGASSHRAWFGTLYVHPAYWGCQLGSDITYHSLDYAGKEGIEIVRLVVTTTNAKIIPFYKRLGFTEREIQYDAVRIGGYSYDWLTMELRMDKYKKVRQEQR